jgi:hypothetical protein
MCPPPVHLKSSEAHKDLFSTKLDVSEALWQGQTYTDVTASRSLSTIYTNSTNKPIMVIINLRFADGDLAASYMLTIDGVSICTILIDYPRWVQSSPISFIVPPGSTYSITNAGNGVAPLSWAELR